MVGSRLQRIALVATSAILAIVAGLTLGPTPDRTHPIEARQAVARPDDISAALRHCATLEGNRIEEAGCMAVWEESRRRFFGAQVRSQAPATAPVMPIQQVDPSIRHHEGAAR